MSGKNDVEKKQAAVTPSATTAEIDSQLVCAAGKGNVEQGAKADVVDETRPRGAFCSFFFDLVPPLSSKKDDPMSEAGLLKALHEEYEFSRR